MNKLTDRDEIIEHLTDFELDDTEIHKITLYNSLPQFEKDLLFLCSQHPVPEVARLYSISRAHVYNILKKIKTKLS